MKSHSQFNNGKEPVLHRRLASFSAYLSDDLLLVQHLSNLLFVNSGVCV
jgi:hypothetical protein